MCSPCKKMLLASPDTDVDPIKPGQPYDKTLYHQFARPVGWEPPKQKVLERPPVKEDWVVVRGKYLAEINGALHDLNEVEGRVLHVSEDGMVNLALAGNAGVAGSGLGSQIATVPTSLCHVMAPSSFAVGDSIKVLRGDHRDREGRILAMKLGDCTVKLDGEGPTPITVVLPIERLERTFK